MLSEDQNQTIGYIRALLGHSHGVAINPNLFCLEQILSGWKEHLFHTRSSSNNNQSLIIVWAGGWSLRSTRQACFFSALNSQETSSRQHTIARGGDSRVCGKSNQAEVQMLRVTRAWRTFLHMASPGRESYGWTVADCGHQSTPEQSFNFRHVWRSGPEVGGG